MYRILVCGLFANAGGIESVIMNYYRNFNLKKIHLDFLCCTLRKTTFEDEVKSAGSKVYHIERFGKNPVKNIFQLKQFFNKHALEYNCLWYNASDLSNITILKMAKKYNIEKIIVHSHNSRMIDQGIKGKIKEKLHLKNKNEITKYATDYWACSKAAAQWLFPNYLNGQVKLIKNAIEVKNYQFNLEKRNYIRNKYNLNQYLVLGNIGRLNFQKNQLFALKVLKKIKEKENRVKLIFVGVGEDKEKIINEAKKLNIYSSILFAGYQKDVQAWYSAFDIFLFPSVFEGLSVSLLEAQANGISVLASDRVSKNEIKINDNFYTLRLNQPIEEWAYKLIKISKNGKHLSYNQVLNNFIKNNYDIKIEAPKVEELILENE